MSRRRRIKKRKRLAYGVITVTFILLCFLTYLSLHQSNQTSGGGATPPQAAIVDHLSYTGQPNPTFVNTCINILNKSGLTWKYYKGEDVTVNFYRKLPSYGSSLIILRVHSAIMKVNGEIVLPPLLGLFTSERYSDFMRDRYYSDIHFDGEYHIDSLIRAHFPGEEVEYFGIGPKFIEKRMKGNFQNAIIIMMGCEGLGYIDATGARGEYIAMADAFIKKGAKVYIGWDGPVVVNHTDQATVCLLQHLISKKQNITRAVEETMEEVGRDPTFNSALRYHPETVEVKNYTVPNLTSGLTTNVAYTSPTPRTPARSRYTAHGWCLSSQH